jgi:O-acetyl-ADP-ribose deacetylase (regulator of RNase III)
MSISDTRQPEIVIIQGDITEQDTDAIVNAANSKLWMGEGVAGAIKRKGGEEIEKEALSKSPIPIGEAVATKGGRLKAKFVIHAATMGMDFQTDARIIEQATLNSLKKAEEMGLKSIALPALGTGVGGFGIAECARIMLLVARDFCKSAKSLQEIRFVLFDRQSYQAFEEESRKYS